MRTTARQQTYEVDLNGMSRVASSLYGLLDDSASVGYTTHDSRRDARFLKRSSWKNFPGLERQGLQLQCSESEHTLPC